MKLRIPASLAYGLKKLATLALTLFSLATLVFFLLKLIPGDEARVVAGETASAQQLETVRQQLGLSGTLADQYLAFLGRLSRGDIGTSTSTHGPVADAIAAVLPATLELVILTMFIIISVAFPLAARSALKSTSLGDSTRRMIVIIASGIPTFWLALVLQFLIGSQLHLLPIAGRVSVGVRVQKVTGLTAIDALLTGNWRGFGDAAAHLVLPAIALSLPYIGQLYRVLRAEILRALTRDHVTVARAAGIGQGRLMRRHVIPQVLNPALTILGVEFGAMFGSAILVEAIFSREGIGSFLTNAVAQKDTYSVLGGVLVIGIIVVGTNLAVDIIHMVRDPRIRAAELRG
ncbi:ABC transporter permease [Arthrobacter bambusae]|uniref:ABC transporter permease n=1 Tax=Arthrobacter bambusae TaxID=1338426 RepID=UPI002789CB30|nr:ABC transporter permease [Arthrobacter bambusae]MDQ0239532.1 peptide/nickel transport system permease protein [Arthrobacter bambusae]